MKNFRIFHLKTFIFLVVKFSVYLNRLVLVMYSHFPPDLVLGLTLSSSNYRQPCLEQISMAPKRFAPLKFDCVTFVFNL